jgi:predicted transcriptional regulator
VNIEKPMSKHSTPVETFFEIQRETIKETENFVQTAVEMPMEVSRTFYLAGDPGREMRDQVLSVSRESIHRSLDAIESVPGETPALADLRESVDETFDILEERNADACNSVSSEYEQLEDDLLETVSEQIDMLIEFNEELESQFVEALDAFNAELETITEETTTAAEEITHIEISETDNTAENGESTTKTDVPADKVECLVCGEYFDAITHPHLQTHDMTIEKYREEFGEDVALRPDERA